MNILERNNNALDNYLVVSGQIPWPDLPPRSEQILATSSVEKPLFASDLNNVNSDPFAFLRSAVSDLAAVEQVLETFQGDIIHLYFVYSQRSREEQRKVYKVQLELMEKFKGYKFIFHDVIRGEQFLESVLSPQYTSVIYSRAA